LPCTPETCNSWIDGDQKTQVIRRQALVEVRLSGWDEYVKLYMEDISIGGLFSG